MEIDNPSDWNDLHSLHGLDEVRRQVLRQLENPHAGVGFRKGPVSDIPVFDRPVIKLIGGNLPEILDQIDSALLGSGTDIFIHGGSLVKVIQVKSNKKEKINRSNGANILGQVDANNLVEKVTACADIMRFDARSGDDKRVDLPRRYAESYLSRNGDWELRHLTGVIESPTINIKTGELVDKLGYDLETGLYFIGGIPPDYLLEDLSPSRELGFKSLYSLKELCNTFPFVHDSDLAGLISTIITSLIRRQLPSAPMPVITAPTPGTGKSLCGDMVSIISTGRRASVLGLGDDQSESDKRLSGALLAGDPVIVIDNVERPLSGDLFCQMLTQPALSIRPLGGSSLRRIPTNCLVIANGNNVDPRGDLRRRVMLIRLDSKLERPETRRFNRNPIEYTTRNRGKFITAALTLVLAYRAAGYPEVKDAQPYGGFEEWDRYCRLPLMWLGMPDPLAGSESLRNTDPDLAVMRQLYHAWLEQFDEQPVFASDIIDCGNSDIRESLITICAEHVSPRRLAGWLRRHRGRVIDGLVLDEAGQDSHRKVMKWRVTRCG